jgi:hypothetical protein
MNQHFLKPYLELKVSEITDDPQLRSRLADLAVDQLAQIRYSGTTLAEAVPKIPALPVGLADLFLYALLYAEQEAAYDGVIERDDGEHLGLFESLVWIGELSRRAIAGLTGTDVPPECRKLGPPDAITPVPNLHCTEAWAEIRQSHSKRLREAALADVGLRLKIPADDLASQLSEHLRALLPPALFLPPPCATVRHNLHVGDALLADRAIYFQYLIEASKDRDWRPPTLPSRWINVLRTAISTNQMSFSQVTDILRKLCSATGPLARHFFNDLDAWAQTREHEYQYPAYVICSCLVRLVRDHVLPVGILDGVATLPGSPAYNVQQTGKHQMDGTVETIVAVQKSLFQDVSGDYCDCFAWENRETVSELARRFHTYTRRKGNESEWQRLLFAWLRLFDRDFLVDVALDILKNVLFVPTDEVAGAFEAWLSDKRLMEGLNGGTVLIIYDPGASVSSVRDALRGRYFGEVRLDPKKWVYASRLDVTDSGEPVDGGLLAQLRKGGAGPGFFESGEDPWTDVVYLEDNIGTGSQAIKKLTQLRSYLAVAGLARAKVWYWSYLVDRVTLEEKLRQLGPERKGDLGLGRGDTSIEWKKDVGNLDHVGGRLVRVRELVARGGGQSEAVLRRLRNLSRKVLADADLTTMKWVSEGDTDLGYGGMGLLVVFEYGTPNTTLPLLWRDGERYFAPFPRPKEEERNFRWDTVDEVRRKFTVDPL